MINLSPFFYRNLIDNKKVINKIDYYDVNLIDDNKIFEATVLLSDDINKTNISLSEIYNNADGGGSDSILNIAIYKAISEALERWSFYYSINDEKLNSKYFFNLNPTTSGLAAFPGFSYKKARENAFKEAVERFAISQFNLKKLPIIEHASKIKNLRHFEIITQFKDYKVSLLMYENSGSFTYSFACEKKLIDSFNHALIELCRNLRVLKKHNSMVYPKDISDQRLLFYSSINGNAMFRELIDSSPKKILIETSILCDLKICGPWDEYTKVYRILFKDMNDEHFDKIDYFLF